VPSRSTARSNWDEAGIFEPGAIMLAFSRSLIAVIVLGIAATASVAQERGGRDADRNNSHENARQRASE
jgi:hypothetical protein